MFWIRKTRQYTTFSILRNKASTIEVPRFKFCCWETKRFFSEICCFGPIHTSHFGTQYCDKKIKDIARIIFFSTNIFFTVQIKNIYFCLFEKILKCYYNILTKIYLFIAISFYFLLQYCVPKCLVWINPLKEEKATFKLILS